MNKWQRFWLYFLILYSSVHLLRDVQQDLGMKTILSTILVKHSRSPVTGLLWSVWNTYVIAIIEIILSVITLRKNIFSITGYSTIIIAIVTIIFWSYYWFFL
jgi:hypothetical protein